MKKEIHRICILLIMTLTLIEMSIFSQNVYATDGKVESAISWAINIANDDSHGYSQSIRWGPHYDCSSFVYSAFYNAGFNLPKNSGYTQTMVNDFTKAGFSWIPWNQIGNKNNLQRGDILLNNSNVTSKQHTEIYLGNGKNVGAHSPSKGISVSGYYDHPWTGVLRYNNPPTNPKISKSQIWYDLGDTIQVSAYADNATGYYMSMFKDGNRIISQGVNDGKFSMSASKYGLGNYSFYFSCYNNAGSIDTKWLDFSVVDKPSYSNLSVSQNWYDLNDTVLINLDTVCAKGVVLGVDKEGVGRVYTEKVDLPFKISASQLGEGSYSAYFSVYNGSGSVDTKRVSFKIYGMPKTGAYVQTDKENYSLDDKIVFKVYDENLGIKGQVIGIDKDGKGRVLTKTITNPYVINASELGRGKYSFYCSVYNGIGGYDTKRATFSIDEPIQNCQVSLDKSTYDKNENISLKISSDKSILKYLIYVKDSRGNIVLQKETDVPQWLIEKNKLQEGKYTIEVNCSNYAFNKNSKPVSFTIVNNILATNISLNQTSLSLNKGESKTLSVTINPSNATDKSITWTTSNNKVATVTNGKVTAVGVGTATITVKTSNGKMATCNITVKDEGTISTQNIETKKGQTIEIPVFIDKNPGIVGMKMEMKYDASKLQLLSINDNGLLDSPLMSSDLTKVPYILSWGNGLQKNNNFSTGKLVTIKFKILNVSSCNTSVTFTPTEAYGTDLIKNVKFSNAVSNIKINNRLVGDVNGDGEVKLNDALLLRRYVVDNDITIVKENADVNGDGEIKLNDALLLRRYVAGWNVELK